MSHYIKTPEEITEYLETCCGCADKNIAQAISAARAEGESAKLNSILLVIDDLLRVHVDSTGNSDQYFLGMANGMICISSCLTGEEPKYFNKDRSRDT